MECVSAIKNCMPAIIQPSEKDSLSTRVAKVALWVLGSLVGFVFLPLAGAVALSTIVTIGCVVLYCRDSRPPQQALPPVKEPPALKVEVPPSFLEEARALNNVFDGLEADLPSLSPRKPLSRIGSTPTSSSSPGSLPSIPEDDPPDSPKIDADFHTKDGLPVDSTPNEIAALFMDAMGTPRGVSVPKIWVYTPLPPDAAWCVQ